MAVEPKSSTHLTSPLIATATSRLAFRGRPSAAPQIEELNQTAVGTEGEWLPSEMPRPPAVGDRRGQGAGKGFSSALAKLASGYPANEAAPEQPETVGQPAAQAAAAYEATMQQTAAVVASTGQRYDRLY